MIYFMMFHHFSMFFNVFQYFSIFFIIFHYFSFFISFHNIHHFHVFDHFSHLSQFPRVFMNCQPLFICCLSPIRLFIPRFCCCLITVFFILQSPMNFHELSTTFSFVVDPRFLIPGFGSVLLRQPRFIFLLILSFVFLILIVFPHPRSGVVRF